MILDQQFQGTILDKYESFDMLGVDKKKPCCSIQFAYMSLLTRKVHVDTVNIQ